MQPVWILLTGFPWCIERGQKPGVRRGRGLNPRRLGDGCGSSQLLICVELLEEKSLKSHLCVTTCGQEWLSKSTLVRGCVCLPASRNGSSEPCVELQCPCDTKWSLCTAVKMQK